MTVSARGGPGTRCGCTVPPQRLGNRVVGEIELTGDPLDLASEGLTMIAYSAAPGSHAEDQLKLLAAWSATAYPASESARRDIFSRGRTRLTLAL